MRRCPFRPFSALPGGRIHLDVVRYRVVEDCGKSRACVSCRTPREPLCHDYPFPLAYFLGRDVGQRPTAELRENVNFDRVFVVDKRGRLQVLSRIPLVNPLD